MAKKITGFIKLTIPAGAATPAPPVGPALGQHGLPIMEFVKAFNDKTADMKGTLIPAVAEMIKKAISKDKGAQKPGKEVAGTLTMDQAKKIAEAKLEDLNTDDV